MVILSLEDLIKEAIIKVNGTDDKSLGRFLPAESGGYMHYFTLRKMKQVDPQRLYDLIQTYVIQVDTPQAILLKVREPCQMNKRMKQFTISEEEMKCIIDVARRAQDRDLIKKLMAKQGTYPDDDEDCGEIS